MAELGAKWLQDEHFINKRCSESSNRRKVYLGHLFATLPSTNMLKINQHTTKLSKALLTAGLLGGAAVATLGAGSAQAAQEVKNCSFGTDTSHPLCSAVNWTVGWTHSVLGGDKTLTNLTFLPTIPTGPAGGPPSGTFSFIYDDFGAPGVSLEDIYSVLTTFDPSIPEPSTGSYSYDLAIDPVLGAGYTFGSVELDVDHAGIGQVVTKAVTGIPDLVSIDGMPVGPVPLSGTSIKVTDSWVLNPATGTVSSISNSYKQTNGVPGPLPLLGVALGFSRKLRKRIKGSEQLG